MRTAAALLLPALLLAGCTSAPADKSVKEKEETRGTELAQLKGWDRFFAAPDSTVGAANQFGFHASAYAASGHVWRSEGGPVMVADSFSKQPSRIRFTAEGPSSKQVDTIRFDLEATSLKPAADARKRFATIVRDFLYQAGIEADALLPAIEQGVPARGDLAGSAYTIETSTAAGAEHLTVTFHRTGTASGAEAR